MAPNRERHGAAVVSAGTPQSNKVGLQARGLFDVLFTCSPEVWVRVWTAVCLLCDPLDTPVTCPGCCPDGWSLTSATPRTSVQQKQWYKIGGPRCMWQCRGKEWNWAAITAAVGRFKKKHPVVCWIRMTNISHGLGCARNILSLHL